MDDGALARNIIILMRYIPSLPVNRQQLIGKRPKLRVVTHAVPETIWAIKRVPQYKPHMLHISFVPQEMPLKPKPLNPKPYTLDPKHLWQAPLSQQSAGRRLRAPPPPYILGARFEGCEGSTRKDPRNKLGIDPVH